MALTFAGLKLTFLALPCSSPETAGWLLKPCLTFRAVSSSWGGKDDQQGPARPLHAKRPRLLSPPRRLSQRGDRTRGPNRPPPGPRCQDTGTAGPSARPDPPQAGAPAGRAPHARPPRGRRAPYPHPSPGASSQPAPARQPRTPGPPAPRVPPHARPPHLLLLGVLRVDVRRAEARALERAVLVAEDAEGRHPRPAGG